MLTNESQIAEDLLLQIEPNNLRLICYAFSFVLSYCVHCLFRSVLPAGGSTGLCVEQAGFDQRRAAVECSNAAVKTAHGNEMDAAGRC